MSSIIALRRSTAFLRAASPHAGPLQLALLCCESRTALLRAFSAKADDDDKGESTTAPASNRGSWRDWVEQQLSGIDQGALNEEQQAAARQLRDQQLQQSQAEAQQQPDTATQQAGADQQQLAQAEAAEEARAFDADSSTATAQIESPGERTSRANNLTMPANAPHPSVIDQPVSELSAADPAEPPEGSQEPSLAAQTQPAEATALTQQPSQAEQMPAAPDLNSLSHLSVDERVEIFIKAIRDKSWEQTRGQPVTKGEEDEQGLRLPPSGYTELGAVTQGRFQGQMLNPSRIFYPGQRYEPEELLPVSFSARRAPVQQESQSKHTFTNKQVLAQADFRNVSFLNFFVSDGGQIEARQRTKLQSKVHRHLARQIKTARVMALLPHEGRAAEFTNRLEDLSDSDFAEDGEIDDSKPFFRRAMLSDSNY